MTTHPPGDVTLAAPWPEMMTEAQTRRHIPVQRPSHSEITPHRLTGYVVCLNWIPPDTYSWNHSAIVPTGRFRVLCGLKFGVLHIKPRPKILPGEPQ